MKLPIQFSLLMEFISRLVTRTFSNEFTVFFSKDSDVNTLHWVTRQPSHSPSYPDTSFHGTTHVVTCEIDSIDYRDTLQKHKLVRFIWEMNLTLPHPSFTLQFFPKKEIYTFSLSVFTCTCMYAYQWGSLFALMLYFYVSF